MFKTKSPLVRFINFEDVEEACSVLVSVEMQKGKKRKGGKKYIWGQDKKVNLSEYKVDNKQ